MKSISNPLKFIFALVMFGSSSLAHATPIVWVFALPAQGVSSLDPSYETVATLTLEEVGNDVKFTFDPNENNSNVKFGTNNSDTKIAFVDFVFSGATSPFNWTDNNATTAGPKIDDISIDNSFDTNYTYTGSSIQVDYFNSNSAAFRVGEVSMWTIHDTTLADFSNPALSSSHPSPTFAIMSLSPITGNSSNWVVGGGATNIPEPTPIALMGIGLLVWSGFRRRKFY